VLMATRHSLKDDATSCGLVRPLNESGSFKATTMRRWLKQVVEEMQAKDVMKERGTAG
jgi:hypothetical protein